MAPSISTCKERRKRRANILFARRASKTTPFQPVLQPIDLLQNDPKTTRKLKNRESACASRRKKVGEIILLILPYLPPESLQ